jgi:hypothetical protein
MNSHFRLKELQEMRNNYRCDHASKNCLNVDTPMCERHEANYIQLGNYQSQIPRDQYFHQSPYEPPQSNNDYEKSLAELNNDVKRDFEDFRRYWCSTRTSLALLYDHSFCKPVGVPPQKAKSNLKPLSPGKTINQDQPRSETEPYLQKQLSDFIKS